MNKAPKKASVSIRATKDVTRYRKGWNRQRVEAVVDHYENQTIEEVAVDDDAAYCTSSMTMMGVPNELVPKVRALIAERVG